MLIRFGGEEISIHLLVDPDSLNVYEMFLKTEGNQSDIVYETKLRREAEKQNLKLIDVTDVIYQFISNLADIEARVKLEL